MTNDTSLNDITKRRRRRAVESAPLQFLGFANVDGIYCRRFKIINSSLEIFEDYHSNRIYQLQPSPLLFWRISNLTSVANENENPLVATDFDLDAILKACNPQGRMPPPRLIEGALTNTLFTQSEWGTQVVNISLPAPPPSLMNLNQSEAATLFNLSAKNFSAGMPAVDSDMQRSNPVLQPPSNERFDSFHPEKWINTSDPEEYNRKRREHQQRALTVGTGKGCVANKFEIPVPTTRTAFLEGGSLFTIEWGGWYPCDQKPSPGNLIATEVHITASAAGYKCPTRSGDVQIYIPTRGSDWIVNGALAFELSLRECLSSVIPKFLVDFASFWFDAKLGLQLQFGINPLRERSCPGLKCVGYVTTDNGGCWLKKEGAFYQWPQARPGVHSYILTKRGFSYDLKSGTDSFGYDIHYAVGVPSSWCWYWCTYSLPAWCAGYMLDSASLNTGVGKCWLKSARAFQIGNMRPLSWVHSYVKIDSVDETYRPIQNYDSWGSDLQFQSLPSSACQSACNQYNELKGRLGDFERTLIGVGKGYGSARFLNMGADFDLSLNVFYGMKCANGQNKPMNNALMGIGVDFGVSAYIDFWLFDKTVKWRGNLLPAPQTSCPVQPVSSSYFDDEGKGYYMIETKDPCVK